MYKIPFIKPKFPTPEEIQEDYKAIVESNWYTNFGPYERNLRNKIVDFLELPVHVVTVANATLAIDIASRILFSDKRKKHIVVPSFTFVAGPSVLISQGLTPVFIDIEPENLQPNVTQAREYIIKHQDDVGGILLCNIFGVGNKMVGAWEDLAAEFKLPLLIDSAAGFGSQYNVGELLGARGDCEIFSLHATKPFSVGEGGLIISKDEQFTEKARSLENFGFAKNRSVQDIGTNAKLQELNCAIGLRQLTNLKDRLNTRRESLGYYKELLTPMGYKFQDNDELSTVPFVSALAPSKFVADKDVRKLESSGVEVRRYYAPLHNYPILSRKSIIDVDLSVTEDVASRIVSFPLHDGMSEDTINYICNSIK